MQLQIQTLQKDLKESLGLNDLSFQGSLDQAFPQVKVYDPSLTLLTQLRQIQQGAIADYYYLKKLRTKALKILYEEDYQSQLELFQKGFLSFKFCLLEKRFQKTRQQQFIENFTQNFNQSRSRKSKVKKADQFYQQKLSRKILEELSSYIKIKKKSDFLQKFSIRNNHIKFLINLKQNMKRRKNKKLEHQREQLGINTIFVRKTLKKYFIAFKLFTKYIKLQKSIKTRGFKKFCLKIFHHQKQKLTKIQTFQQKQNSKLIKKIFESLKQNKLQSECFDWYCYRLQKVYFKQWANKISVLKSQQQIQAYNDVIVQHFIDSKASQKRDFLQNKYFGFWKSFTIFQKQQKKQTQIFKSFAQLKQKEYLERKYFQILKNNRNLEKAYRFFKHKLKIKALEGFKINVLKQSEKLQKIYRFIQKRNIKKYFDRIKLFNKDQKSKIWLYKLKVVWSKFTFNITMQYFQKIQKAKNYYETLLKFKSLIGLKESVEFNKKAQHCGQKINIVMPIKRWILRSRLRKFVDKRQFAALKRTVFEWKILTVRKALSSQKEIGYSQLFVQSKITEKKGATKDISQNSIYSKCKKEISQLSKKQPSFFMAMEQSQSQEDDQVQKKVDALLTKIKNKKKLSIKDLSAVESQIFTNEKLIFANKNKNNNFTYETGERLRVPTWNSPDTAYKVSVFSQDLEEED